MATAPFGIPDTYMPLIGLAVYWHSHKNVEKNVKPIMVFYLAVTFVVFGLGNFLIHVNHVTNNLWLYHLYTWFEVLIISRLIILHTPLKENKWLYKTIALAFTIFCLYDSFLLEPFSKSVFNSIAATIANLILLSLSMYYLLQMSKTDDILYFHKLPVFWIVTAFLVSSAISFPLLLKYKDYTTNPKEYVIGDKIFVIMDLVYIIKFALISIGILCYKKPSAPQSLSP